MTRLTALLAQFSACLRLAAVTLLLLGAGVAQALPSACTAIWGTNGTNLRYYNTASNTWIDVTGLGFSANSIGGYESNGTLYFTRGVTPGTATMYRAIFSNTTGSVTFAQVSATPISTPANLTYTNSLGVLSTISSAALVGATMDRDTVNPRMFLYLTSNNAAPNLPVVGGGTSSVAAIGILDPEAPTAVTWSVVHQTTSTGTVTYPRIGGSGDIYADQQAGQIWIVTNASPQRMLKLNVNYTGLTISSAQVATTATIQVGGVGIANSIGGVAVDPRTGFVYTGDGQGNATWQIQDQTASPVVATLVSAASGATDAGNCVAPPDPPTVTKSFNPTTATTPGTSLLTITINNPNKVPIYTTGALTDAFPAGLAISATPSLSGTCFTDGTALGTRPAASTITGVAGATSAVIASGSVIPGGANGGSCSFSVRVSATAANLYENTIPAGSLTSTAGNNAAPATASFQIQNLSLPNLPLISKSFTPNTSTNATGTATLTIVITNPNTSTNTLTALFRDAFPANMQVANPPTLSRTCFSNGTVLGTQPVATTITGTPGSTSVTIALNSVIPGGASGGSCSFSVRISATVAGIYANTIPAGSLTTVSGSNPDDVTATYSLRASDFSVVKSQREGTTGGTTTAQLDVPSGVTISYVISIRNGAGVPGTRTFTDTLPPLVTPTLSVVTATVAGATGCRVVTSTVAGPSVRISGTVTGAPVGGGCDITIVAKSSVTAVIGTATNSIGIYTVTGALDSNTADNTASVVMVIKPAALLTIAKTDSKTVLLTGSTNSYTITVANGGPAAADGALVYDPPATGLDCSGALTCSATGLATCPIPVQLFVTSLQTTGVTIPSFPSGTTVSLVFSCLVTATGEP